MGWKEIFLDKDYLEGKEKPAVERPARVVVTGIDIGFFSLVALLARIMLAAIPAMFMAAVAAAFLWAFLGPFILALARH